MPQRHRQNFIGGLVEDNPLTSGATTLTSAALAAVDTVTLGDTYIPIILDPDGIGGAPEIAYITAHAASATTATISRAEESTSAREHKQDIRWVHGPTSADFASDWALIEEVELSSDAANITFSNIPDYWRDLVITGEMRLTNGGTNHDIHVRVGNGTVDSGANYDWANGYIDVSSSTVAASRSTAQTSGRVAQPNGVTTANYFSVVEITIASYADSSRPRRGKGSSNDYHRMTENWFIWNNSSAVIDTVQLFNPSSGNIVSGSRLSLFGRGERRNP